MPPYPNAQTNLPRQFLTPHSIPDIIKECMKVSALRDVFFTQDYPKTPLERPTIVWRVVRRVNGAEGVETKKPRFKFSDPTDQACLTEYWGQLTTIYYQFDIFGFTNEDADRLMEKFESFMHEIGQTLSILGVHHWLFDEQKDDPTLPVAREIPNRSLGYIAVMTTFRSVYIPRITQILRYISVSRLGEDWPSETVAVTRGTDEADTAAVIPAAIASITDSIDSVPPDYIPGVDYTVAPNQDGTHTVITWMAAGRSPETGATYYVRHTPVDAFHHNIIS